MPAHPRTQLRLFMQHIMEHFHLLCCSICIQSWNCFYRSAFSFLQMVTRTKKIFVGGLSAPSTLEDVKNYFEQFGRVSSFLLILKNLNPVWRKSFRLETRKPCHFLLYHTIPKLLKFPEHRMRIVGLIGIWKCGIRFLDFPWKWFRLRIKIFI